MSALSFSVFTLLLDAGNHCSNYLSVCSWNIAESGSLIDVSSYKEDEYRAGRQSWLRSQWPDNLGSMPVRNSISSANSGNNNIKKNPQWWPLFKNLIVMYILILCNPSEVEHWDITSDNRNEREKPKFIYSQMVLISGMTVTCEWTSMKLLMVIRLEKIKLDKNSMGSINPLTDRLCKNGENSTPLLDSPGASKQHRSRHERGM